MSYIKDIFKRSTISGLTEYLLYGEVPEEEKMDYEKKLEEAYKRCEKTLMLYDTDKDSPLYAAVCQLLGEYEKVYTQIGFQAGLLVIHEAMENRESKILQ